MPSTFISHSSREAATRASGGVAAATFRIRRRLASRVRHRFVVMFSDPHSTEVIGGAETLREAITFALNLMGPGDTLDVRATI